MAEQVKFDYSLTAGVISEDEMKAMEKITKDAKDVLVGKSGAGNDFLGWIDLPVDYDKEEFARIQKAAQKIQSDSEVLLVIGIGGSYRGLTATTSIMRAAMWPIPWRESSPGVIACTFWTPMGSTLPQ